jgi:hypothetical protein
MRTIRFARCRHPGGETECAGSFLVLGWRLPVKADARPRLSSSRQAPQHMVVLFILFSLR